MSLFEYHGRNVSDMYGALFGAFIKYFEKS